VQVAEVRASLLAAVLAAAPSVEPGTRMVAYQADQVDSYEAQTAMRPRLARVRLADAPEVSRWTTTGAFDTAAARIVVEIGYPADWRRTEDGLDDAIAADVVTIVTALRGATWPSGLHNLTIGPSPVLSTVTGTGGAIVALILTFTIGVEYATGS
jgi:hypothetical protein